MQADHAPGGNVVKPERNQLGPTAFRKRPEVDIEAVFEGQVANEILALVFAREELDEGKGAARDRFRRGFEHETAMHREVVRERLARRGDRAHVVESADRPQVGLGVEHVVDIPRQGVVGQRVAGGVYGRAVKPVAVRGQGVSGLEDAGHPAEGAVAGAGEAVDVEVAADQHRLARGQPHLVDQALDLAQLPLAQRPLVETCLKVSGEEMDAAPLLVDPGVEHALFGYAVVAGAVFAEQPLELPLDRPLADDDDAAVLAETAVAAEQARLIGILRAQVLEQLAPVPVAEQLLQHDHVVARQLAGHLRHALVLSIRQKRPQEGVEGQHVERGPGRLGRRPGRGLAVLAGHRPDGAGARRYQGGGQDCNRKESLQPGGLHAATRSEMDHGGLLEHPVPATDHLAQAGLNPA